MKTGADIVRDSLAKIGMPRIGFWTTRKTRKAYAYAVFSRYYAVRPIRSRGLSVLPYNPRSMIAEEVAYLSRMNPRAIAEAFYAARRMALEALLRKSAGL